MERTRILSMCLVLGGVGLLMAYDAAAGPPRTSDPRPSYANRGNGSDTRICSTRVPRAADYEKVKQAHGKAKKPISSTEDPGPTAPPESILVPVVFHIITSTTGEGNVSGLVDAQIQVLNDAHVDSPFFFVLDRVEVVANDEWFNMAFDSKAEKKAKTALRVGDSKTLNIYTANLARGYLGWSTYPWEYAGDPIDDGVVLRYTTFPGAGLTGYDEGDSAVHEVGHWLGLFHTFEGGGCNDGDLLVSTPAEQKASYGCPIGADSCPRQPGLDSIYNFMNYTSDSCMIEFTEGQLGRMDIIWHEYR